jgi:hypothetical protein
VQGVDIKVLSSGLHIFRFPSGDWGYAVQLPNGYWKATAKTKVRWRVGRPYSFASGSCHRRMRDGRFVPGYHHSLEAAIRCAEKAMPGLRARADAFRAATAPGDREAITKIRKRRDERVGPGWQSIRRLVLDEEPLCRECGASSAEVDHIVPVARGGTSGRNNLQGLCRTCHIDKTRRDLSPRRGNIRGTPSLD